MKFRTLNKDGTFNIVPPEKDLRYRLNDISHSLLSTTWPRFLALVAVSYFAVNFFFSFLFWACGPEAFEGGHAKNSLEFFLQCFFFSVQTFSTIGYGHVSPVQLNSNLLVTFEALAGLLSVAVITGLLFARFVRPTARILFSRVAVVTVRDDVKYLMFRMANRRANQIVNAEVTVTLLMDFASKEGEKFRRMMNLSLDRKFSPMFALSWTLLHQIDSNSPLHEVTPEELEARNAEFIISVSGVDESFAQLVHARESYTADEIVWNSRFKDVVERDPTGRIKIKLESFHETVGT